MSAVDELMSQLQSGGLSQLSQQLGIGEDAVQKVASGALPTLLAGLARNTASPEGASSLLSALDRDHDGSILDDLGGFFEKGDPGSGAGILGHILGNSQSAVEGGLGKASGLDAGSVGKILVMLAPVVLGAVGKAKNERGLDADGLASALQEQQAEVQRSAPDMMSSITGMLDADGDGSIADEISEIGGGLLGGLLGGKR